MSITIPHRFEPRDYQLPLFKAMDSGINRAVIVHHRRAGKDKTCFNYMIKRAVEEVGTYFYFLPTYAQAKKVIWDNIDNDGFKMLDHIPRELIANKNATELKIELVNGSVIQLIGADKFSDSGVGTNPRGVVFSEYSINKPEVWDFVRPILRVNGGWAIFNFTPRGQNHAFKLLEMAKTNDKWFWEVLTIEDTDVLKPEDIEEEKKAGMPQDMIDQEFYCKFIEGATSYFKGVDDLVYGDPHHVDKTHRYQLGVDLAKFQDYTVITPVDLMTFEVGRIKKLNQIDYANQKEIIIGQSEKYETVTKPLMWLDSTGVGAPIFDDLSRAGLQVSPFTFTERSRNDLLQNLQMLMEQRKIFLPNNPELISQLKTMQYTLTARGKVRPEVPEGMHDDMIMSLALACWQLPANPLVASGGYRTLNRVNALDIRTTSYE